MWAAAWPCCFMFVSKNFSDSKGRSSDYWVLEHKQSSHYQDSLRGVLLFSSQSVLKVKSRKEIACSLTMKCSLQILPGNRVPAITNHFRNTTGYLDSFEPWIRRSDEEQYSEEVLVFKSLSTTNGPQNTLSFTHLACLLTSPSASKGGY